MRLQPAVERPQPEGAERTSPAGPPTLETSDHPCTSERVAHVIDGAPAIPCHHGNAGKSYCGSAWPDTRHRRRPSEQNSKAIRVQTAPRKQPRHASGAPQGHTVACCFCFSPSGVRALPSPAQHLYAPRPSTGAVARLLAEHTFDDGRCRFPEYPPPPLSGVRICSPRDPVPSPQATAPHWPPSAHPGPHPHSRQPAARLIGPQTAIRRQNPCSLLNHSTTRQNTSRIAYCDHHPLSPARDLLLLRPQTLFPTRTPTYRTPHLPTCAPPFSSCAAGQHRTTPIRT